MLHSGPWHHYQDWALCCYSSPPVVAVAVAFEVEHALRLALPKLKFSFLVAWLVVDIPFFLSSRPIEG